LQEEVKCWNAGGGVSQDFGVGAQIELAYNYKDFFFIGLIYQTPVKMIYKDIFDSTEMANMKI